MEHESVKSTISIDPSSGEQIGTTKIMQAEELYKTFERASEVQKDWAALPLNSRISYLLKVREYIVEHLDEMADVISRDNGKLKMDALSGELIPITMAIGYYCKIAAKVLKDKKLNSANIVLAFKRSLVRRLPIGVVGIISPWNYPFSIPMFDVIPGLLAGNAIILKTATETQMVSGIIKNAFEYADIPQGVMNVVNVPGRIIGDSLLDMGVGKLFFTGSVEIGQKLAVKAAENFIPVSLELGGNDSMIVCKNADIDRAVGGAIWGGFQNSGQSCGGIERIYVEAQVYDVFMDKLKKRVNGLYAGAGSEYSNDLGFITTNKQAETVREHIQDALDKGAEVHAQSGVSSADNKCLIPATVLCNVDHSMKIMREETFGPVVCVMKVNNIDEAIELANDSDLGLTASIWTKDNKYGINLSRRLETGVVNINDHLMSHGMAETPWGGMKKSGNGRSHGEFGMLAMTNVQVVVKDVLPFVKKHLWWHPFSEKLYNTLIGLVHIYSGKNIIVRIKGLFATVKAIPRIFKAER